jgi:hypothetical protein
MRADALSFTQGSQPGTAIAVVPGYYLLSFASLATFAYSCLVYPDIHSNQKEFRGSIRIRWVRFVILDLVAISSIDWRLFTQPTCDPLVFRKDLPAAAGGGLGAFFSYPFQDILH